MLPSGRCGVLFAGLDLHCGVFLSLFNRRRHKKITT
jgi:hypothetical protein